MANIKSAKKRAKQALVRTARNQMRATAIKTACRKVVAALEEKDIEAAKVLLRDAEAKIARARSKRLLKRNTASNKISALAKQVAKAARSEW
jgi:small subunit ribosomal protein S20